MRKADGELYNGWFRPTKLEHIDHSELGLAYRFVQVTEEHVR